MSISNYSQHESEIRSVLENLQKKLPLLYGRFPDSKMAGNMIQRAPSDFWVLYDGKFAFLEAKFSEKYKSLSSCFASQVPAHQLATAKLAARAGGHYFIFFCSGLEQQHEVWPGAYCQERRSTARKLEPARRIYTGPSLEDALIQALAITPHRAW